jgi:hypothetical protein
MDEKQFMIVTDKIWQILKSQGEQAAQAALTSINDGLQAHNQRLTYESGAALTWFHLNDARTKEMFWRRSLGPIQNGPGGGFPGR